MCDVAEFLLFTQARAHDEQWRMAGSPEKAVNVVNLHRQLGRPVTVGAAAAPDGGDVDADVVVLAEYASLREMALGLGLR